MPVLWDAALAERDLLRAIRNNFTKIQKRVIYFMDNTLFLYIRVFKRV